MYWIEGPGDPGSPGFPEGLDDFGDPEIRKIRYPVLLKGHKNLRKSPTCFNITEQTSKQVGDFFKFCGLLTMS